MTQTAQAQLKEILLQYSYEEREVTLASGQKSNFYFDGKQTTLHPQGAKLVGELILKAIQENFPKAKAVGGPTLGADPIATAVGVVSAYQKTPLATFIVRKEPKKHGTMNWIEGSKHLTPGMPVVIVEDVITTGGSLLKACEKIRQAGLLPLGCIVLVDREEGGRQNIEKENLKVVSLFTKSELLN